jgi:cytochrome c oxidase cbb3-type subunit 3
MADQDKHQDHVVHTYDGDLEEEDNRLPLWWQYTLYGAVVFAVAYWIGEHKLSSWLSRRDSYDQEMVAVRLEEARAGAKVTPELLVAMSRTPSVLEAGRQTFVTTCAQCHRADGGGNIGPNLTDEYWLHGNKPEDVYTSVHEGVPAKGMPTWAPVLGEVAVDSVVAYVLTLRNTNVPGGKAPQGEKAD